MNISEYTVQIVIPQAGSHKGENGRVLVIGGSRLFHAAAFWSACMASKVVDMVHFSSPALENNELMRVRAKSKFWDGIVVPYEDVSHYIAEDDVILIGPGMERGDETKDIVDALLRTYPDKKWVIDGGALQMVDPRLLTATMIATPNYREKVLLGDKIPHEVTVLAKGTIDRVTRGDIHVEIEGGNAGMTKGGTGDVLAGLVAALYAQSDALPSAVTASYATKKAGERIAEKVGVYFSASDLIPEVQKVLSEIIRHGIV